MISASVCHFLTTLYCFLGSSFVPFLRPNLFCTDGERTEGLDLSAFMQRYAGLDASAKKIPVFLILFAEGEARALSEIAKATGGKVFDARKQPLASVFKEIRAYQ